MKIKNTKFKDLKVIHGRIFYDKRGSFREVYKNDLFKKNKPLFWCASKSKKNVLRGLHLQKKNSQAKFVSVLKGILSDKNSKSIFIPKGFAHGFLGLDQENIVLYSNDNYRSKKNEIGIIWNDKNLNIKWPKKNLIISKKDKLNITFDQFLSRAK